MMNKIIFILSKWLFSPSEYIKLKSSCNYGIRQLADHERGPTQTEIRRDDLKCLSHEYTAMVKYVVMKIYDTSRFHGCIYLF